jgi:ankyrin repeat protein
MLAANSDALPVETVQTLLARGADVHAKSSAGFTALDFASMRGDTPVSDLLVKAGATRTAPKDNKPMPQPAASARAAVQRSLPLIQKTDSVFLQKTGCVSCHNNTLAAVSISSAR